MVLCAMASPFCATPPRYSLVIPAFNEEGYLPRLLDSVDVARERFAGGPEAIEVIVADNASTDRTGAIAEERGCRVAYVEERRIACSRNGGAAIARGEFICFVDADSRVHPETFNEIEGVVSGGKIIGGTTGFTIERMSAGLWLTERIISTLSWLSRIGAGVFFCEADAFREIGGYAENRDYAEDVVFFFAMRKLGRKRGQKTCRTTAAPMTVSTRKFDRHGDWHMLYMILWIPLRYGSMGKLVRAYWYDDAR